MSDLHPEKKLLVCWLRFQIFLPLTSVLAKHSVLNTQIYTGEMSACLQDYTYVQIYAYVDTQYPWKSTRDPSISKPGL